MCFWHLYFIYSVTYYDMKYCTLHFPCSNSRVIN